MKIARTLGWRIAGIVLACLSLAPGCRPAQAPQAQHPRYFRVAEQNGIWSLEDPQEMTFFSIGINVVAPIDSEDVPGPKYDGLTEHRGDVERWKAQTLERLNAWNVNTIGAWSNLRGKPYVVELSLTYSWIDVFGEDFETYVRGAAMNSLKRDDVAADYATLDSDPLLIGYFTDNELAWGWGYGWTGEKGEKQDYSLFEFYASMKPETAGKRAWASYLAETYHQNWKRLSEVWTVDSERIQDLVQATRIAPRSPKHFTEAARVGGGFLQRIAERYFEVTSRVMRAHLPHHLNLGTRLTPGFPEAVAKTAGQYVDVVSFNMYTRDLDHFRREVTRLHNASGRPVLITEFAFPAWENRSGNKNRGYEDAEVRNDKERGDYLARCVAMFGEMPFVVGCHWFQHHDEPTNGRSDGESVNFGFVDLNNRVYEDLARSAADANARVVKRRGGATVASLPEKR